MATNGRPTLLSKETAAEICKHLRTGASLETCCKAAGIWPSTLWRWRQRAKQAVIRHNGNVDEAVAEDQDGAFVEFCTILARAEGQAELALVERVSKAGKGGWAAGWLLEHGHGDAYSQKRRQEVDATVRMEDKGAPDADEAARLRTEAFLAGAGGAKGETPAPGSGDDRGAEG